MEARPGQICGFIQPTGLSDSLMIMGIGVTIQRLNQPMEVNLMNKIEQRFLEAFEQHGYVELGMNEIYAKIAAKAALRMIIETNEELLELINTQLKASVDDLYTLRSLGAAN